jgi:hypothetical protein
MNLAKGGVPRLAGVLEEPWVETMELWVSCFLLVHDESVVHDYKCMMDIVARVNFFERTERTPTCIMIQVLNRFNSYLLKVKFGSCLFKNLFL